MWSMLSVDIDDSFSSELLDDIIKLWVTIRGFSTVSAWMEEYKQTTKTGTHKSLKGYEKLYLKYEYQKKIRYLYI